MYSMKPIHQASEKLDLPDKIYKMQNIHGDSRSEIEEELMPAMKALEETQLSILKRLQLLEREVKCLNAQLGCKFGDPLFEEMECATSTKKVALIQAPAGKVNLPHGTLDFVISVSKNETSLFLLLIQDLLKECGISVAIPVHIHSSCNGVPRNMLDSYGGKTVGRTGTSTTAKVFLTVVFKEDPFCPSLMYTPLLQTRIIGDVNIARYLCRFLLPHIYNDNDTSTVSRIDTWLESARKIHYGSLKEKELTLKKLNASLGQNTSGYLCNDRLTLADIAVLSSLLSNISSFKSLPKNVKAWFRNCLTRFNSLKRIKIPNSWTE